MSYPYFGITDVGYGRTNNEDYLLIKELDKDTLIAIIADGAGSHNEEFQPAALVSNEIFQYIKKIYEDKGIEYLLSNIKHELSISFYVANRCLGMFKLANEELYGGYASSVTCCILGKNNFFALAHSGNTRLYLLRDGLPNGLKSLTTDGTKGQKLVDNGTITKEQYYTNPERLKIEAGLGFGADVLIQVFAGTLKEDDKILLTTDGVHYAIREEVISEVYNKTKTIEEFCNALILLNKEVKYIDNASAILIVNKSVEPQNPKIKEISDNIL